MGGAFDQAMFQGVGKGSVPNVMEQNGNALAKAPRDNEFELLVLALWRIHGEPKQVHCNELPIGTRS